MYVNKIPQELPTISQQSMQKEKPTLAKLKDYPRYGLRAINIIY